MIPVDGVFSPWSEWAVCSKDCGGGKRNRSRTCNGRLHGGKECIGSLKGTEDCNTQPCPGTIRNNYCYSVRFIRSALVYRSPNLGGHCDPTS